ncbi:DUF3159 domain-containing protein [Stackebrandtia soli]|uniref:DUF3159 domain-containing protein n=1 Tax=Stackebrandtia soli TaxID=1892856 RepID=UPI0039E93E72
MSDGRSEHPETLASLLGGRRGAIDATLPPVAFALAWAISQSIPISVVAAVVVGIGVAIHRLRGGTRPRAVLISLGGVVIAGIIALYTGRAEDFFLLQLLSNGGSALAWAVSIVIRWPLLGVVVGTALRQGGRWRRDPALLASYGAASWVWVCQYLIRLAVFIPLWWLGWATALGFARAALTWPLIAACIAVSWWVFKRRLPSGHPGIRHPVAPESADSTDSKRSTDSTDSNSAIEDER